MRNWRRHKAQTSVRRSVITTDNEEWNAMEILLQDTRTSLRAFLDLLEKHDETLRVFSRRTRRLNKAFTRNFPADHLDPRVIARARQQALSATPPSPLPGARGVPRCDTSAMVYKLVHDYLNELDVFALSKFHKMRHLYQKVAVLREVHKILQSDAHTERGKMELEMNMNALDVALAAYQIGLERDLPKLIDLLDKRFVAYKAVRVAYWATQLQGLDAVRDTLQRSLGTTCTNEVAELDTTAARMHDTVNTFVERLSTVAITKMTKDEVAYYRPTEELDDACEHSFHTVLEAHDPRERQPRKGIFKRFQPRNNSMSARVQSMPPTSRHSPISDDEELARVSLPPLDASIRIPLADDSTQVIAAVSPVSSFDGRNVAEEAHITPRRLSSSSRIGLRKLASVNVQWLRKRFETPDHVSAV